MIKLLSQLPFWSLVLLLGFFDALAVIMSRIFHENNKEWQLWLALIGYSLSAFMYIYLLGFRVTAVINIIYIGVSAVLVTGYCYLVFQEKVSWDQLIGIILIIYGVNLL